MGSEARKAAGPSRATYAGRRVDTLYFDLLRLGYTLGLAVIVGGGFALGALAAPAIFATVRSPGEAGTIFGAILARFDGAAIAALVLIAVTAFLRAGAADEDPRDLRILGRWIALALMAATTLYASAWANPVARAIRKETPAFDDLPDVDPRRREFRALHERSRRAFSVAVILGILAMYLS